MDNYKAEKKNFPVEVTDDALEQVNGGTDNHTEVIPNWSVADNTVVTEDAVGTMMPVGAITEE